MASESAEQALKALTTAAGEDMPEVYAKWAALSLTDPSLGEVLRRKLVAGGHSANIKESGEASVKAGGGTGESLEQMLLKTGLTGLS